MSIDEGNEYQVLAAWIDWEGGVDGLIEYGVDLDNIPEDLRGLWSEATFLFHKFADIQAKIYEILEKNGA